MWPMLSFGTLGVFGLYSHSWYGNRKINDAVKFGEDGIAERFDYRIKCARGTAILLAPEREMFNTPLLS